MLVSFSDKGGELLNRMSTVQEGDQYLHWHVRQLCALARCSSLKEHANATEAAGQ